MNTTYQRTDGLQIGDYVRNKNTGKFGCVVGFSSDNRVVAVQTIKRQKMLWRIKSVIPIKAVR